MPLRRVLKKMPTTWESIGLMTAKGRYIQEGR